MGDALLIGRVTNRRALTNVESARVDGERIELAGRISLDEDHLDEVKAVRDQLVATVANPDEPFTRLAWEKDPTLDSMVRVTSAGVDIDPGALVRGWAPWRLTAQRIPSGELPNVESTLIGGHRQNGVGMFVASAVPWHAVPAAALDYYDGVSTLQPVASTRTGDTGSVAVNFLPTGLGRKVPRFTVPPGNWYDGAARVEALYGTGWETIGGRRFPQGTGVEDWRASNGLLRVSVTAAGVLQVESWTGTGWGTVTGFTLGAFDGVVSYTVNRFNTVAVTRNSPEEIVMRLTAGLRSGGVDYPHRTTLDVLLRRGARLVECRWSTQGQDMLGTVAAAVPQAGTAMTGGGRSNAADADGNRFVMFSPVNVAFDALSCSINATGAGVRDTAFSFAVGLEIGGAGSVAPDRAADVRNQYFGPYAERMSIVGW